MKNIHILPTDKPSRLLCNHTLKSFCFQKEENGMFVNDGKVSGASFWSIEKAQNNGFYSQHIYITNDEKIIKSDWAFNPKTNKVVKTGHYGHYGNSSKKIILTTDVDLIKDGVQVIDDEFLEWFVKNPSCEEVKLDSICKCTSCGSSVKSSCDYAYKCNPQIFYKIIIPKEEPKIIECYFIPSNNTSSATICGNCGQEKFLHTIGSGIKVSKSVIITKEEPKQETLEETYNKWSLEEAQKFALSKFKYGNHSKKGYITIELILEVLKVGALTGHKFGAKWQQERSYTEEEVDKLISDFKHDLRESTSNYVKQNCEGAIFGLERLKQFKKK